MLYGISLNTAKCYIVRAIIQLHAIYSTVMPQILMDARMQAIIQAALQLETTILCSYVLLVFAIHGLTTT